MSLTTVRAVPAPRRRTRDVLQVLESLRRENPRCGDRRLAELLADELLDDRELAVDAGRHLVRALVPATKPKSVAKVTAARRQRVARQEAEKRTVQAIVAKVREIAALDMIMPNGEKLRFCRGSEVAQWGAGFSRIAQKVPADALVGEVLCESQAQELMRAAV